MSGACPIAGPHGKACVIPAGHAGNHSTALAVGVTADGHPIFTHGAQWPTPDVTPAVAALLTDLRIAERIVQEERKNVDAARATLSQHHEAHEKAKLEVAKVFERLRAEVCR